MRFTEYNLSVELQKGIEKLGFTRPTDIQYKSIPPILRGEDVLAVAQTGTGKTAAFAIPILHMLHERKKQERRPDGIKCIVMVPTHELAIQITDVFQSLGRYTNVKVLGLFGGVEQDPQIEALEKRVDVLITTPGRMFDLISQEHLRVSRVEMLVLDEADHMLDLGFIKDIRDLSRKLPRRRQTLFFSATINDYIKKLAYSIIHQSAIRIQISPKDPVAKNIDHAVTYVDMDDKRFFLERLIREHPEKKMLVFVRTKVRAERVSKAMTRVEIDSLTIHSDKDQEERNEVMDQFRRGKTKIMIATDVSARGIDIPDVDYVINYDLPEQAENYVHRVGRTGRGKKRGQALAFCSEGEKAQLEAIENYLGHRIEVRHVSKADRADTLILSDDPKNDLKALLQDTEAIEERKRKKGKGKRKKR